MVKKYDHYWLTLQYVGWIDLIIIVNFMFLLINVGMCVNIKRSEEVYTHIHINLQTILMIELMDKL